MEPVDRINNGKQFPAEAVLNKVLKCFRFIKSAAVHFHFYGHNQESILLLSLQPL